MQANQHNCWLTTNVIEGKVYGGTDVDKLFESNLKAPRQCTPLSTKVVKFHLNLACIQFDPEFQATKKPYKDKQLL